MTGGGVVRELANGGGGVSVLRDRLSMGKNVGERNERAGRLGSYR